MKRIFSVIICLTTFFIANAQYYTTGDDPLCLKLRQIQTPTCRIIFDKPMQPWATRLAQHIDSVATYISASMQHTPRPIDLMLHSRDAYSNGLVSWAPRRIEFYTFPQTDGDCLPWTTHLVLHEYRHVAQTSVLNSGFTRFLNFIFGEQATGAVLGVYVPLWLMEGDAVTNETAMSHGGRGRQASFIQQMRTIVLNNQTPSYDQAYNGSYKYRFPDYYHMGYLTVSNAKLKYGNNIWTNALKNVGQKSFSLVPFNRSLHQQTRLYKTDLYAEAINNWRQRWTEQDNSIDPTPYSVIAQARNDYNEYTSAQITNNGIIFYATSPSDLSKITNPSNTTITIPTIRNENNISAQGNTIVWCEMRPHLRWNNAHTSVLMLCNAQGKHKRTIIKGKMLSTPSVSPNEKNIATVCTQPDGQQTILLVDIENKKIVQTFTLQQFEQATATTWLNNNEIAYISLTDSGKCIRTINISNRQRKQLTTTRFENIRHIAAHNNTLYYTSDATGLNNIYQLNQDGTTERITSSRFGAAWPCPTDTALIYSEYSANGYSIVCTPLTTRPTDKPISPMHNVADSLSMLETKNMKLTVAPTDTTISKYSRAAHLFRFHSWGPIVVDANDNSINAGVAIASQNTLGNSILSAGINWNNETSERYFASYTYTALYPKIELKGKWGYNDYKLDGAILNEDKKTGTRYIYDQRQHIQNYKIRLYIPLTFAYGAWISGITPAVALEHYKANSITLTTQTFDIQRNAYVLTNTPIQSQIYETKYSDIDNRISAYLLRRTATRNVGYRYGITLEIGHNHSIGKYDYGNTNYAVSNIYLPGIGKHHNIWIQAQMQKKQLGSTCTSLTGQTYKLLMSNYVGNARGTTSIRNTQSALLSFNYTLPLVAPDLSIGPICYIKRICLRGFCDTQRLHTCTIYNENNTTITTRTSVGGEIWAESFWLRLPYCIKIGYRGSKVIDANYKNEMLLTLTIK